MIALAVFSGVKNQDPAVKTAIQNACNEAITSSPFSDASVQELRDACTQDNIYYLNRSVIWTAIRAALQVPSHCNGTDVGHWRVSCPLVDIQ